ncbi:hypothetical protein RJ55_05003 [Drechmeria coniospora]|nr:hypothetical protein RJ55_05003 [Drechmeria coniospora]
MSLPPCRTATGSQIASALRSLHREFCPLPAASDFHLRTAHDAVAQTDSGYVTEDEIGGQDGDRTLRDDPVERDAAVRWLTGFIGRADELAIDEELRDQLVEDACFILSHLTGTKGGHADREEDLGMTREFVFDVFGDAGIKVTAELLDTPMQTTQDHTDVGMQTWGASVAMSELLCHAPGRFGLEKETLDSPRRIVEFGAGTGLVTLVLARLLPLMTDAWPSHRLVATDYHPAVLQNLERNIGSHAAKGMNTAPSEACHLDWSAPTHKRPLDKAADFIFAADVAYAPEHALWLRDCAGRMLAPDGIFWLMVSVRPNGKFEQISDSVEASFADDGESIGRDGRILTLMSVEKVDKHKAGRGDEVGYKLYKIGWAQA